jgi:hypothetical protein
MTHILLTRTPHTDKKKHQITTKRGLNRDLNPGPLAPKARIIPLDH